jgi:hypothetical protein
MDTIIHKYSSTNIGNNILEIDIGHFNKIHFNRNINIIYFETMLTFFKKSLSKEKITKKVYSVYYDDDKILMVFSNGSSISNKVVVKESEISSTNNIHFYFKVMNIKKIPNDNFEPKYTYDKIESYDSIIFNYNNIDIEFIKIKNKDVKYNIRLSCTNENKHNLEKVLKKFTNNC